MSRKIEKSTSPPPSPSSSSSSGTSSSYASSSASSSSDDDEKQTLNPNEQEDSNGCSESYEEDDDNGATEPNTANELDNNTNIVNNKTKKPRDKTGFRRIWSQPDEIAVLKGLVGYQRVNGPVPMTNTGIGDFHAAIAGSLSIDVNNSQLVDKVRRLRQRWRLASARGRSGEAPRFSKPHNELVYDLSRRAWGGGGGGGEEGEAAGRADEGARRRRARVLRKYCPTLMEAVEGTGNMAAGEAVGAMETGRARGLEGKLKRRKVEGMKHHLLKMELQMETVKLIMEGIKNSSR